MELLTTNLPRHITVKSKMYGFELMDFFLLFFYFNVTNFILPSGIIKFVFVWGSTAILGFAIHRLKANKQDNFLTFYLRYLANNNVYLASLQDTEFTNRKII